MAGKTVKTDLLFYFVLNSDGSDKQVPIVIGKSPKQQYFKNVKKITRHIPREQ
jgi:hypothetical protein